METLLEDSTQPTQAGAPSHRGAKRPPDQGQILTATLEGLSDAVFVLDSDWRFIYLNAQAEALLQRSRDALLGSTIWDEFPEAIGSPFQIEYEKALAQGNKANFQAFYAPLNAWFEVDAYPSAQGLAVYFRNVTARHEAEQRGFEEREILTAVLNSTNDAILSIDQEGRIEMFNPGAERVFHRSRASVQGLKMELLVPARFRAGHVASRSGFAQLDDATRMMGLGLVKGLRSDGQEIDLEGVITRLTIAGHHKVIVSMRDVTQRTHADAQLQQSRQQLSELAQKLMLQEKVLVKGMAQVLHDHLGQTLAALRMSHEAIITLQQDKNASGIGTLQARMGLLIGQAIRQVRQVLTELRPPLLEEQGLCAALDNELRNRSLSAPQIDISIDVTPQLEPTRWPPEVEYAAFMVVREAVENSVRHAQASTVAVSVLGSSTSLQLEIVDNGVGITVGEASKSGHLGIIGMHERAHAVGAHVTLRAGESRGTVVAFVWKPA